MAEEGSSGGCNTPFIFTMTKAPQDRLVLIHGILAQETAPTPLVREDRQP
jgi:hypothetical protein